MKIHFLPFLDTFVSKIRENVSRNRRNDKKCLEIGENVSRNRRNDKQCVEMGEIDKIHVLPFLNTFGSRNKRKSVQKQEKRQKVSRNGRKRFLPFIDTSGSKIREKVYRNRRNDKKFLEMGMIQKA